MSNLRTRLEDYTICLRKLHNNCLLAEAVTWPVEPNEVNLQCQWVAGQLVKIIGRIRHGAVWSPLRLQVRDYAHFCSRFTAWCQRMNRKPTFTSRSFIRWPRCWSEQKKSWIDLDAAERSA